MKFLEPVRNKHRALSNCLDLNISQTKLFSGLKGESGSPHGRVVRPCHPGFSNAFGRRTSCRSLVFLRQLCLIDCSVPLPSFAHRLSIQEVLFFFLLATLIPHLVNLIFYSLSWTRHHLHRTFCSEETCHPWHLQIRCVGDCADRFHRLHAIE